MSDQQQSTTQAFPSSDQQQSSTQAFVKKTAAQRKLYESGNELAAYAAKQINYHIMGYYPITPSTQIAENLDLSGARGEHNIRLIAAEGEHSAAGICYGASAGGGRVFNATSANGLLYALEQFPVQSGTRMPLRYNNDKQKKPLFSRGLSVCRLLFNSFSKLKIDENYKEKRRLFY